MERFTGKTMDCFVEFPTHEQAQETVSWLMMDHEGKLPRIGRLEIQVEKSSQDELLKQLFPRSKCTRWEHGMPVVTERNDEWSTGFTEFITEEELFLMVRHAKSPGLVGVSSTIFIHLMYAVFLYVQKCPTAL